MNWLSAKKVRQHGMTDERWSTKDVITQYKGLVNLHQRDFKIMKIDHNIAIKKQKLKIKNIRKDIDLKRNEFVNLCVGDRQQIRNTLQEHRDLLLAFQQLPAIKVIDNIEQYNFNKRKKLDRYNYEQKIRSKHLTGLKLRLAELEDRLTYRIDAQLPVEEKTQIVTGKVQDAILKKEAALAVKNTYLRIRDIMKQDAMYYDVLLDTIRRDGIVQGRCMIRATELGQLATEYLDDRRRDFARLEMVVKRDMKERELHLLQAQEQLDNIGRHIRGLIRRDSDVNLGKVYIPKTEADISLKRSLEEMERLLDYLKHKFEVSNYEQICECLEVQAQQKDHLNTMTERYEENYLSLKKKLKHARVQRDQLANGMLEGTQEYMHIKKQLKKDIKNQIKENENWQDLIADRGLSLRDIETAVKRLGETTDIVNDPNEVKTTPQKLKLPMLLGLEKSAAEPPTATVGNALEVIKKITPKVSRLMKSCTTSPIDPKTREAVLIHYAKLIVNRSRMKEIAVKHDEEDLLDNVDLDFSGIPTREDIKRESEAIAEEMEKLKQFAD